MKNVNILGLVLITFLVGTLVGSAQKWSEFGNWSTKTEADNGEVLSLTLTSDVIKGNKRIVKGEEKSPGLYTVQYYGKDGGLKISYHIAYSNYKYDADGDKNTIRSVKILIDGDKNTLINATATIVNENGYLNISTLEDADHYELYKMFSKGNFAYIKLNESHVYKFSLKGFKAADSNAEKVLLKSSNPFSDTSEDEDPF